MLEDKDCREELEHLAKRGNETETIVCDHNGEVPTSYKHLEVAVNPTDRSTGPLCTRYQATRICGLYFAYFTVGISQALMGTTLLELQIQTSAEFDHLTMLLTWSFVGRLVSAFTASAIFDRLQPDLQLGLSVLLCACASACIPLSRHYYVVSLLIAVQGFGMGYSSTGGSARCFELFGDRVGPFLQALYFTYSLGGAISPPITKPFLTHLDAQENNTNHTGAVAVTSLPMVHTPGGLHPGTFYPYLILTAIQILSVVYYMVLSASDKCAIFRKSNTKRSIQSAELRSPDRCILALFSLLTFCSVGMEITFGSLLYAYTVKYLEWDVDTANNLMMVFWVAFAISRACGMLHARFIQPQIILTGFLTIQAVCFILITSLCKWSVYIMWVCVPFIGIALSTQLASIFLYAGKHFTISGRTSGLLMVFTYSSGIVNPPLTGYLFKNVHMQWFMYLQLIFMGIMLAVFITIRVLSHKRLLNNNKEIIDADIEVNNREEKKLMTVVR